MQVFIFANVTAQKIDQPIITTQHNFALPGVVQEFFCIHRYFAGYGADVLVSVIPQPDQRPRA